MTYSATGDEIQRAIEIATEIHKNQYRKGGCKPPYIVHPIAVLNRMLRWGITDSKLLAAAPLHDTIEDGKSPDDIVALIKDQCGQDVLEYTFEMSCPPELDKKLYMESFKTKSVGALLTKVSDRLCNVDDFFHSPSKDYAGKYFRKADVVFKAFIDRKAEIVEAFGKKVWASAFYDFKQTATYLDSDIKFYRTHVQFE
jgi:(p)ppGpp synthase/HD superfamily hydrolase